jgi:RimJ/RimL family protein N-acetyltransferase
VGEDRSLSPPQPPLGDGVVELRPWTEADAPAVYNACHDDAEIDRWLTISRDLTEDDAVAYVRSRIEWWRRGTKASFAVVDVRSREVVGSLGVHWIDWKRSIAELGDAWVERSARRRGVATRAIILVSRWALFELGFARVQCTVDVRNFGSRRFIERAGFKPEGVHRSFRELKGERVDELMLSLIPEDLTSGGD